VNDGGVNGNNSNYIGIDAVKYTLPCGPVVQSYTTCASVSTTLQAVSVPATTYSWSTGGTSSSIVVNPSSTTVYTLFPSISGSLCGTSVTATITVGPQMAIGVSSNTTTICSGNSVTLSASAPAAATTISWTIGTSQVGSGSSIVVSPSTTTTYSVGAQNGSCFGFNGITINVNASPSLTLSINPTPVCLGATGMTVTASGANTYTYVLATSQTTTNPLTNITVPTQTGTYQFGIFGTSNGCTSGGTATFAVNANPTVAVTSSTANACTNSTVAITASGAASYSWSGAASSTNNPVTYTTGATAGSVQFSVVGTSSAGCKSTATFTQNVVVCTSTTTVGVPDINGYEGVSVFPNPFSSELKITSLDGKVVIFNAIGQEVMNVLVNSSEVINTANLPKGVYMVKAFNSQGELAKTVKLIKN